MCPNDWLRQSSPPNLSTKCWGLRNRLRGPYCAAQNTLPFEACICALTYLDLDIVLVDFTVCKQNAHCHCRNYCCSRLGIAPLANTPKRWHCLTCRMRCTHCRSPLLSTHPKWRVPWRLSRIFRLGIGCCFWYHASLVTLPHWICTRICYYKRTQPWAVPQQQDQHCS